MLHGQNTKITAVARIKHNEEEDTAIRPAGRELREQTKRKKKQQIIFKTYDRYMIPGMILYQV